jgi:hypothetical protein
VRAVTLPDMPEPIHEILPGVQHWVAKHPKAGIDSSSYYLEEERILIDPLEPGEGLDWFEGREPRLILMTNRHHLRSVLEIKERFGCTVRAPRTGMHELPDEHVTPYDFGDELEAGIRPYSITEDWPDETALHIPSHRALAIADGVLNYEGLGFFPDDLLGDDAEHEKQVLRAGFARVCEEVDFDHLLPAHGSPIVGDGRETLLQFAKG